MISQTTTSLSRAGVRGGQTGARGGLAGTGGGQGGANRSRTGAGGVPASLDVTSWSFTGATSDPASGRVGDGVEDILKVG